ncbi:MAG: ATP-grasp domain-containing protein [Candidatus Riflebacteria bacterium]|nr:ATP-grasp domain-containing protein [Candidatus Riflebacteria bacterium]
MRLLIAGHRRDLILAAARVGHSVVLVDPSPPRRSVRHLLAGFHPCDPSGAADLAGSLLGPFDLVIASGERWVLPAAQLRERLGVSGPTVEQELPFRDKLAMKRTFQRLGLAHARYIPWPGEVGWEEFARDVGFPLALKPRMGVGGAGFVRLASPEMVPGALSASLDRFPEGLLLEEWMTGPECSVETFLLEGTAVLASVTEYVSYGRINLVSPTLPDALDRQLLLANDRAIEGLGKRAGMTHLEFFLTPAGPVVSEIAGRPPGGYLMDLIALAWGLDPWALFLDGLTGSWSAASPRRRTVAGNVVIYPPGGTVRGIHGVDAVRALPGLVRFSLRLRPGEVVAPRRSLGQTRGVIVVTGPDAGSVRRTLLEADRLLRIEMESSS